MESIKSIEKCSYKAFLFYLNIQINSKNYTQLNIWQWNARYYGIFLIYSYDYD